MSNLLIFCLLGIFLIGPCHCILLRSKYAPSTGELGNGASLTYSPDPEMTMNATEIIRYHGYPAEEYRITTEDGYLIYIQRIPHGKQNATGGPRPVVILQHGLLCSSTNWITNLPGEGLGFILADEGYDVWLGNMRGNFYGLGHKTLPVKSKEFWDFSFDEMAEYQARV